MKNALVLIAILVGASTSFAAAKDLKTMGALEDAGVQGEQFMSQWHVGADGVACQYSHLSGTYDCHLHGIVGDDGQTADLAISGVKAKRLFAALLRGGAEIDNGMGKVTVSISAIHCAQAAQGVEDGTAADRTFCDVTK